MEFREHPSPPSLAPFVECCWSLAGEGDSPAEAGLVTPDGCVELVLGLDGTRVGVERDEHGRSRTLASFVLGLTTRPFRVSYAGSTRLLGIRLRTAGALQLLGTELASLVDRAVATEDALPALHGPLEALSVRADGDAALAAMLRGAFARAPRAPERLAAAVDLLQRQGGRIDVATVAREVGVSTRQLDRDFERHLGLSPKLCARIARFRQAFGRVHLARRGEWAALAAATGYADQAHLTRDFHEFAGVSPDALRRQFERADA